MLEYVGGTKCGLVFNRWMVQKDSTVDVAANPDAIKRLVRVKRGKAGPWNTFMDSSNVILILHGDINRLIVVRLICAG